MSIKNTRRDFLRDLGIGAAALPFVLNLPSLAQAAEGQRKQRLVVVFSPDGVVPWNFWPDEEGADFKLKEIVEPLAPFKDRMLFLKGLSMWALGGDRTETLRLVRGAADQGCTVALAADSLPKDLAGVLPDCRARRCASVPLWLPASAVGGRPASAGAIAL